jgi:hypothetical protein
MYYCYQYIIREATPSPDGFTFTFPLRPLLLISAPTASNHPSNALAGEAPGKNVVGIGGIGILAVIANPAVR